MTEILVELCSQLFINGKYILIHIVLKNDLSFYRNKQQIQFFSTLFLSCSGETSRGFEILNNTRAWINAVALIISSLPVSI